MGVPFSHLLILIIFGFILNIWNFVGVEAGAGAGRVTEGAERLVMVVEMARHGARTHFLMDKERADKGIFTRKGYNIKPQELTQKGRLQLLRKGL